MSARQFLTRAREVLDRLDPDVLDKMAGVLARTRADGGRLFCIGSGGGAAHASHAVCDFRKLCGFEAYCPSDNVAELTARINDHGWGDSLASWLRGSRLRKEDCVMVFSVGGGSLEPSVSENLVRAVQAAKEVGASVVGIVGRDGGFTAQQADACVVVPTVDAALVTPLTEGFQAVLWHLLVSHPQLQMSRGHWETVGR